MDKIKIIFSIFLLLLVYFIVASTQGGKTDNVVVTIEESDQFTEEELNEAIKAVKKKFRGFDGCEMTELWYSEKDSIKTIEGYLNSGGGSERGIKKENVVVLFSNFNVDSSGANNGFNPNSTYTDWNWILVRNSITNNWRVVDWGY